MSSVTTRLFTRQVPSNISTSETVVRAVTTLHLHGGKLKYNLFVHPDDAVSVSRLKWVPSWLARLYALARVQNRREQPLKLYAGLAYISVQAVRQAGADVIDSRGSYIGHADITHGVKQKRGTALPPQLAKKRNDQARAIANAARFEKA